VAPFDVRVPSNSAYFVSSPTDKARTKKVEAFREWALARLGENRAHDGAAAQCEAASPSVPEPC
jgi:LysR family glycine cleavage system transcriptional activator